MKPTNNKYSAMYRRIDRTQLSEQALKTLDKIRLATGNFKSNKKGSYEVFEEYFNKLIEKKPVAVKGTPEYNERLKNMRRENMKKALEKKKEKMDEKKGRGNEIDAHRPAKPFGWRMKGKHNYKKPTRADIAQGKAYYEGRINRADSVREKYPMLERGGMAEEVYYVDDFYPNYDEDKIAQVLKDNGFKKVRKAKKYGWSNQADVVLFQGDKNEAEEILEKEFDNYISIYEKDWGKKYEDGGYMAKGGKLTNYKTSVIYYPNQEVVVYAEIKGVHKSILSRPYSEANKEYAIDFAKKTAEKNKGIYKGYYDISDAWKMADGGYMEHEYKVTLQNSDSGDVEIVNVLANSISEAENRAIEESGLSGYEVIKTIKYAKGGNVYSSDDAYLVEIFKDDQKVDEKIIRARSRGEARENYEDLHENRLKKIFGDDITYTIVLAPSKMAKGGMINHGFRSGDKIIEIYKGYGIIESKDVIEVINPSQGSRYVVDHGNTMDKQIDAAKRMIDNMTPIELVDRIEVGTDRNGSMDRRGVEYAKGGILKEDDFVWNSLGKKLIVDKVTKDEYYLVGFGQPSSSPFSKSKVDNYIKNGEWTLKPKQYAKGGIFYTEKHKND